MDVLSAVRVTPLGEGGDNLVVPVAAWSVGAGGPLPASWEGVRQAIIGGEGGRGLTMGDP